MRARILVQEIADLTDVLDAAWLTGYQLVVKGTSWKLDVYAQVIIHADDTATGKLLARMADSNTYFVIATGHLDLPGDKDPHDLDPQDVLNACAPKFVPNLTVSGADDEILEVDRQSFLKLPKVTDLQVTD